MMQQSSDLKKKKKNPESLKGIIYSVQWNQVYNESKQH